MFRLIVQTPKLNYRGIFQFIKMETDLIERYEKVIDNIALFGIIYILIIQTITDSMLIGGKGRKKRENIAHCSN